MSERTCPIPGCGRRLGTTRFGDPFLMCSRHWPQVPKNLAQRLWVTYRAWQRIEKQWLGMLPEVRPAALMLARATAVQTYIDARDDCVRKLTAGADQLELAQ